MYAVCHARVGHIQFESPPMKGWTLQLSGPVLRDTTRLSQRYPPIARYGVWCLDMATSLPPWSSPFLTISSFKSMQSGGAIVLPPPPLKRASQRYLRDTL